jgi:sialic acid synthase SpsE
MKALIVLGLCVAVLGFYRGWFELSRSDRGAPSNKVDVNLSVDPDKVKEDVGRAKQSTKALGDRAKGRLTSHAEQADAIERIDQDHSRTNFRV